MKRKKLFLLNATQPDERVIFCCILYNQIFHLLKAAFLLKGIQQSTIRINYKPNKKRSDRYFKQGRYLDEANKKSGNYCK